MRFVLSLVAMAGMATLGFLYGPELINAFDRDAASAQAETLTPASPQEPSAPALEEERAVNASLDHLKGSMPPPSKLPAKVKKSAAQPRPIQKKTAAAPAAPAAPATPTRVDELLPTEGEAKAKPVVAKASSRWIDDLSGPKARLSMGKARQDDGCSIRNACERKPAPKDISLVGVVVKSDKLLKRPRQPLEGRVMQGNYVDETPAVYVE
jgi:hypothetical protein